MNPQLKAMAREGKRVLALARNIVRRGVLGTAVDSDTTCQVRGAGDDGFDKLEFWQSYGFASRPPVGGEVLVVLPMGKGEGAIICAHQDRSQVPSRDANEVILYGYKAGAVQGRIRMRPDGSIRIVPGAGQTVDVGADGTSIDFALKGTTHDLAWRLVLGTAATGLWGAMVLGAAGFTAAGNAFGTLSGEAAIPGSAANCTTAGTACGTAAGIFTSAAALIGVYLSGSYLTTVTKVS
ncbi:MAG TPA: hypothetical protein ENL34_03550 [Chloroflexi bacterium]|nr:hypothetical protein [Chloroflexota bacterium]